VSVNVEAIRERLERERGQVVEEHERVRGELGISASDELDESGMDTHIGDVGSDLFDRELDVTVLDNAQDLLRQYDDALARLDAGTYGTCTVCGRQIETDRLETLPYVALCIDDARKREAG
jgi:RNA polymerase-binding transcription factor DksA